MFETHAVLITIKPPIYMYNTYVVLLRIQVVPILAQNLSSFLYYVPVTDNSINNSVIAYKIYKYLLGMLWK